MIDVTNNKSPLAPAHFPDLPPVAGLTFASGPCQVKYVNKTDVLLAQSMRSLGCGANVPGVRQKPDQCCDGMSALPIHSRAVLLRANQSVCEVVVIIHCLQ